MALHDQNWQIIPFSKDTAYESAVLHGLCFERVWSCQSFEQLNHNSHVVGFLVKDKTADCAQGLIVGQICPGNTEIYTLATHPGHRRQGIAKYLTEKFTAVCRVQSIETIFIEVNEKNTSALIFYQNLGFFIYGKRSNYYVLSNNDLADAVLLQLKIN